MPVDLVVSDRTGTTITLTWRCLSACMSNGEITHFEVSAEHKTIIQVLLKLNTYHCIVFIHWKENIRRYV